MTAARAITTRLLALCALAAALLAPARALAQDAPSVTASAPSEVYVGDTFAYRIEISGDAGGAEPPDLAGLLPEFDVRYHGPQTASASSMTIINGRVQQRTERTVTHTYALTARRAGEYVIPAVDVVVGRRTLQTTPLRVRVQEPAEEPGLGAALDTPVAGQAYVGQPFRLTLSWLIATDVEDASLSLNLPPGVFDVHPLNAGQTAGRAAPEVPFTPAPGAPQSAVRGRVEQVNLDGELRNRFVVEFLLAPLRAGRFELGPARADYRAVVGRQDRSRFTAPWERNTITQRRFTRAAPKGLEVLELPTAGRPAGFSGLIGQFELNATASPREASVGDPLTLTLALRSKLPLLDAPTIDLTRQMTASPGASGEDPARLFRLPRDPILPQVSGDVAVYTATIRARSASVTEVPPVGLWHFDPVARAYRLAQSNPVSLKLKPAAVVGLGALEALEDEDAQAGAARSEPAAGMPPERSNGLYPPIAGVADGRAARGDGRSTLVALSGLVGAPALLWAIGVVAAGRRRAHERDPAGWRRRRAARRARRALARARGEAHVAHAMRRFMADLHGLPDESMTSAEAVGAARADDPVLASRLAALLAACDERVYGPGAGATGPAQPVADARVLVDEFARVSARARPFPTGGGA